MGAILARILARPALYGLAALAIVAVIGGAVWYLRSLTGTIANQAVTIAAGEAAIEAERRNSQILRSTIEDGYEAMRRLETRKNEVRAVTRNIVVEVPRHVADNPVCNLSDDAVRVLNAALAGGADRLPAAAAPGVAGAGGAPAAAVAAVTERDLASHVVIIAGRYYDLAARHDALVDWVSRHSTATGEGRQP